MELYREEKNDSSEQTQTQRWRLGHSRVSVTALTSCHRQEIKQLNVARSLRGGFSIYLRLKCEKQQQGKERE